MDELTKRIKLLEGKVAYLEEARKDSQLVLDEIVNSWQKVITDFANQYGIELPENIR